MPRNQVTLISNTHEYDTVVDIDLTDAVAGSNSAFHNNSGSGVYIGGGIILTAAHVIGDNNIAGFPVRQDVKFGTGFLTGQFNTTLRSSSRSMVGLLSRSERAAADKVIVGKNFRCSDRAVICADCSDRRAASMVGLLRRARSSTASIS